MNGLIFAVLRIRNVQNAAARSPLTVRIRLAGVVGGRCFIRQLQVHYKIDGGVTTTVWTGSKEMDQGV